jgi:fucose 4-O-acetylase-like acetyltransferase
VDILNSMGLAIALMAPLAMFSTRDRMRLGFVTGLVVACAAPIISGLNLGWLHPFIRAYFVPDPNFFSFFPWAAFVAFGISAGSVIRVAKEEDMAKVMQWASLFGIALIVGARYFANLPYSLYTNSDFWLNSPALILIKLGVMYLLLSFAFIWTRYVNPSGWSFISQIGTTSLVVYWVHTEIVYGRWMWFWKESLTAGPASVIAVAVILAMILLSVAWTGYKGSRSLPEWARTRWERMRAEPAPATAGD